jgi:nucleoside-diphosphate-sugar epimerase
MCPTMIYGRGLRFQTKRLSAPDRWREVRRARGQGRTPGFVIDDLVSLYLLALEKAPAGAFYYAENGENSYREVAAAVSRMLGFGGRTQPLSMQEAVAELGEAAANFSFGSNSRVRAGAAAAGVEARAGPARRIDPLVFERSRQRPPTGTG